MRGCIHISNETAVRHIDSAACTISLYSLYIVFAYRLASYPGGDCAAALAGPGFALAEPCVSVLALACVGMAVLNDTDAE